MRISDWSSDVCSSDLHCRKVGWSGIARRLTCGDDLYPALMLHGDGSPEQQASADLMHSQAAMTRPAQSLHQRPSGFATTADFVPAKAFSSFLLRNTPVPQHACFRNTQGKHHVRIRV